MNHQTSNIKLEPIDSQLRPTSSTEGTITIPLKQNQTKQRKNHCIGTYWLAYFSYLNMWIVQLDVLSVHSEILSWHRNVQLRNDLDVAASGYAFCQKLVAFLSKLDELLVQSFISSCWVEKPVKLLANC